jgi:hypothetical protein
LKDNHMALLAATLISCIVASPALADDALIGKWSGPFKGVQIEFPPQQGPFSYLKDAPKKASPDPKFTETPLTLEFTTQKNGLAVGVWKSGEFSQYFVCTQINSAMWNCVDAGGRASIELKSSAQINVCYLDNREGAQGAGCGLLQKTHQ